MADQDHFDQGLLRPLDRLAVDAKDAAALLGISKATFLRLDSAGRVPRALHLSPGRVTWSVEDLKLHVRWGCPGREKFEQMKSGYFLLTILKTPVMKSMIK